MDLYFLKERGIGKKEMYFIKLDGQDLFEAVYDKKKGVKELFDTEGKLLAQGYYWWDMQKGILGMPPYILKFSDAPGNWLVIYRKTFPHQITWFDYKGERYSSYYHFGCIASIYKNGEQIASYRTDNDWSNGWNMILSVDCDVDKILLVIYSLHIYSNFFWESSDGRKPSLNFAFWSKKPNKSWQPKQCM